MKQSTIRPISRIWSWDEFGENGDMVLKDGEMFCFDMTQLYPGYHEPSEAR